MFFARLLPLVAVITAASLPDAFYRSVLESVGKNFKSFLFAPLDADKIAASDAIFNLFPSKGDDTRYAQMTWSCDKSDEMTCSGTIPQWFFYRYEFMQRFAQWNVTGFEQSEINPATHKKDDETIAQAKWTFHKNEKNLDCTVSLRFEKESNGNNPQMQNIAVTCDRCSLE